MANIPAIQAALRDMGIDGWLLYDFRGANVLACRVLKFPAKAMATRRWYYFIPADGEPIKLNHRIEPHALDHLPGVARSYLPWQQLEEEIGKLVKGRKTIAMEYAPRCAIPYVSRVDAGTMEVVKGFGVNVVSSGDLIQMFEATWDGEQWASHLEAACQTDAAYGLVWRFIGERLSAFGSVHELEVQKVILDHFKEHDMVCDHAPIVAVGPHAGDPHYEPVPGDDGKITKDQLVLVDLWAKMNRPRAVYSDLTRMCYTGNDIPANYRAVFDIVAAARDAAVDRVKTAFASGETLQGWQVDRAARDVIEQAGYGPRFVHRTGHSIGVETHGNGANMDDLETRETRRVMKRTCFSVEPGIYLPEFGVRSEVNVYIDEAARVHVTGGEVQREIVRVV